MSEQATPTTAMGQRVKDIDTTSETAGRTAILRWIPGAFAGFDPRKVAKFDAQKQRELLKDPGIVRNRLKISATIQNAKAFLAVQKEFGSFDAYVWQFVGGKPIQNARKSLKEVPARTPESDAMSKDLLKRGFKFVGSTICYAYMQAVGMVNDHAVGCFRHKQCALLR